MTRHVRSQREATQSSKNHGLVIQFIVFCLLRILDGTSSILLLEDAWTHSGDWREVNVTIGNTSYASKFIRQECGGGDWGENQANELVKNYKTVLSLTAFFNTVSIVTFLVHFFSWIATLRILISADITDYSNTRITKLTQNSLLSLMTAVIRDLPLSCLHSELLVLRSGSDGLVCLACLYSPRCPVTSSVFQSLANARKLLYFSCATMFITSFWKGLVGFYRVSRTKYFQAHLIRACAAMVFAFFYTSTTFTPAMLLVIYRYFTIPGYGAPFVKDIFTKLVVIGIAVWIVAGSALLCCPLLYLIKLE